MAFLLFAFFAIQLVSAAHIFCSSPEKIAFSANDTLLLKEVFCNIPKNKVVETLQKLQVRDGYTALRSTDLPYEQENNRSGVGMKILENSNISLSIGLLGTHLTNNPAIKERCEKAEKEWKNTPWWRMLWQTQWPEFETENLKCTFYPMSDYPKGNGRTTTELHCYAKQTKKAALLEALKDIN